MKKIMMFALALISLVACIKPDEREHNSSTELSSLKAFVYYDEADLSRYEEVDLLSGMYIPDKGMASFTFTSDPVKFNAETLKNCRVEAIIPATAVIALTDENGKAYGHGLEGWHDLYNSTLYFDVIADDGGVKHYKISCRCSD